MITVRMSTEIARFLLSNRIERKQEPECGDLRVEAEERLKNGQVLTTTIMVWSIDPAARN